VRALSSACFLAGALLASAESQAGARLQPLFRFSAGSGLFARPGVGQDGALYVGAGDGYVHALASDGSFRWSYTVKGRVLSPPVEEAASRRVFVATSEARLYSLESDSQLRWVFPLPAPPKTELVLTPKGTLFFVGQDDHLYGVTTGGALTLRLAAPAARSAPVVLEGGLLGLVLGENLATLKGYGYARTPLGVAFGVGAKLAVDAKRAIFACDDGRARVFASAGDELDTASDCLSPPVRGEGFFAVAEAGGLVRLVFADSSESLSLPAAPLRPIWDPARRRLIVSTATGSVAVLELRGEP
jgi:hypothetical protein